MDKLNLHYIAGQIDADGSFSISLSDRRYKGNALTVAPVINLRKLTKYRFMLEQVLITLNAGKIYDHFSGDKMSTWQTVTHSDAMKVAEILYPYLVEKKQICKRFLAILKEWNSKKYCNIPRDRRQLTRPKWLIKKMLHVAMTLNKNQQTKTAYLNKKKRVAKLIKRLDKFYK